MPADHTPHQPPAYFGAATPRSTSHENVPYDDSYAPTRSTDESVSIPLSRCATSCSTPRVPRKKGSDSVHTGEDDDIAAPLPLGIQGSRIEQSRRRSGSLRYKDEQTASSEKGGEQLHRQASTATQRNRCASPNFPASALALTQTKSLDPGAIYIEWPEGDPANPFNWPLSRRWILVLTCFLFTSCTAFNGTGYPSGADAASRELNSTPLVYLLGNTTHLLAVAVTPMLLAPLSEAYGRRPIYLIAAFLFSVLFIPQALAQSVSTLIIVRTFQGMVASVGNSMVAGSVSDTFHASERGVPMSLYSLAVYLAQGISPVISTYTVVNQSWRVMLWWNCALGFFTFSLMCLFLHETRGPVLLSRRAQKLTKETGKLHRCRADDERQSFLVMVKVSLMRPLQYILLEPVVLSFSLWIGFLWGLIFLSLEAIPIVFAGYGWSEGQRSLALLTLAVGGLIGFGLNFHQEKLYARQTRKHGGKPPAEARLFYACGGAVLAPIGLFIFAWTGRPSVNPAGPIIGLLLFNSAIYPIYLAVFSYLADVYERYASSALAAQSFLRNILAATFPLFARQMYENLSPPIASTVLASLAAVLGVVPFILMKYGQTIRSYSRAAMALEREEREAAEFFEKEHARQERRAARQAAAAAAEGAAATTRTAAEADLESGNAMMPTRRPTREDGCKSCAEGAGGLPPTSIA